MKGFRVGSTLLILVFCIALTNLFGQTKVPNDTLRWRAERPLTWDDFKGEPIKGVGLSGEVFCLNYATFSKSNLFQKPKFIITPLFDRTKSWIIKEEATEQLLQYFQIVFNIYEVHARRLRKDLSESKFGADPTPLFQQLYNNSLTNLTDEYNSLRRESRLGLDANSVLEWKLRVEDELKALDAYKN